MAEEVLADGIADFFGGMDTSRNPWTIGENQYTNAVNVIIPRFSGGLKSRPGFHNQQLNFKSVSDKNKYKYGNIQGGNWFSNGKSWFLVRVVDGYVFIFTPYARGVFSVIILNPNNQLSQAQTKVWITRIPNGCIINNGINLPLLISETTARFADPSKNEIGIGRMGVYVQNRFCYSDPDGEIIYVSDILNPMSLQAAYDTGIVGFATPENEDIITAIGKQKVMLSGVEGGALVFSTARNIYSVDIRGSRTSWGEPGSSYGKVNQTISGVGATSSYSFEPFNTNLYFRSREFGMCDLRQSEYQFTRQDDFQSQSIEASYWFDKDTDWLLDQCYTVSYKGRLFTTVRPERNSDGFTIWNGILSMHPAASYSNMGNVPRRFESVFTGLKPWCMTVCRPYNGEDRMFIDSADADGINRLYRLEENADFDLDANGNIVEIEGWLEFRAFVFNNPFKPKKSGGAFYRLRELERDLNIKLFSRGNFSGKWSKYWDITHKATMCRTSPDEIFQPGLGKPQSRPHVPVPSPIDECSGSFVTIQDRLEFKGSFIMDHFIRLATMHEYDRTVYNKDLEVDGQIVEYSYRPDFDYKIVKEITDG